LTAAEVQDEHSVVVVASSSFASFSSFASSSSSAGKATDGENMRCRADAFGVVDDVRKGQRGSLWRAVDRRTRPRFGGHVDGVGGGAGDSLLLLDAPKPVVVAVITLVLSVIQKHPKSRCLTVLVPCRGHATLRVV
jgi:hypothetical protein